MKEVHVVEKLKNTRWGKTKIFRKRSYRELVTLEREYHDKMFPSYGKSYNRMNKLSGMVEKKNSGKLFNIYIS